MSQWKQPPLEMPLNNETVWVRLDYFFGQPFLANYRTNNNNFTSSVNSIPYPAWRVSRWKYQ